MNCTNRQEIFEYAHHMLDAKCAAEVEAHVANCKVCRAQAEEFASVDALLDEWKTAEPSPWFDARLRARIESAAHPVRFKSPGRLVALTVASMALLVLAFAVVMVRVRAPGAQKAAVTTLSTPASRTELPFSSTASVSAGSEKGQAGTTSKTSNVTSAKDEMTMYENLATLEDYDMLANFDVLSDFPQKGGKVEN